MPSHRFGPSLGGLRASGLIVGLVLGLAEPRASADVGSPLRDPRGAETADLADDLGVLGDDPSLVDFGTRGPTRQARETNTFYLNFDGVTLTQGIPDDATRNISAFRGCATTWQAYSGAAAKEATMAAFRNDWAEFDVTIVTDRPATGPYIMAVIGPNPGSCGAGVGYAQQDCGRPGATSKNDVVFAYATRHSAQVLAAVIGQEIGHAMGLAHVSGATGCVMSPNLSGDPAFQDRCLPMTGLDCGPSGGCTGNLQNAHRFLMDALGPSSPDTTPPVVQITSPADGASFPSGSTFRIEVEASDDKGIASLELYDGDQRMSATSSGRAFVASNVPPKTYAFSVAAIDPAGHRSRSNTVHVTVGDRAMGSTAARPSSGTASSGGPNDSDSDPSSSAYAPQTSMTPFGSGANPLPPDGGCSCRTHRGGMAWPGVLAFLALLGLTRRPRQVTKTTQGAAPRPRRTRVCPRPGALTSGTRAAAIYRRDVVRRYGLHAGRETA